MKRINENKIAGLRASYERGERITKAAMETGVDPRTAAGYFNAFTAAGVKRGPVPPPSRPHRYKLPTYGGPDWIG